MNTRDTCMESGRPGGTRGIDRITCGASHPDPAVEQRFQEVRSDRDAPTDTAGCGRSMVWTVAFRCVDCGRWFHRDCILKHFDAHRWPQPEAALMFFRLGTVVRGGVTGLARILTWPFELGGRFVAQTVYLVDDLGQSLQQAVTGPGAIEGLPPRCEAPIGLDREAPPTVTLRLLPQARGAKRWRVSGA
jgi:hypothetical protein